MNKLPADKEVKLTSILFGTKPESHQTNTEAHKTEEVRIMM